MTDSTLRFEGTGAPLVYVPGIDGTGNLFYTQTPRLSSRFRVATFRLRDSASTMDELIAHLDHVVTQASPSGEPVTLVAESFGGALAMSYTLAHPSRVQSLVVLNSFAHYHASWQLRVAISSMEVLPWAIARHIRRISSRRHHSPTTHRDDVTRALELTDTSTRAGYLNRLRILSAYDLRSRLHEIAVPTLFLAADQDILIPSVTQGRFMASQVPNAELRVLEGHGHACLLAPDVDVERILREWAGSRGGGAP